MRFHGRDLLRHLDHSGRSDPFVLDLDTPARDIVAALQEDDLIVYSPTSLRVAGIGLPERPRSIDANAIGLERCVLDRFADDDAYRRVVSVGNGRATDIAKYIAARGGSEFIAVPATLSTNAAFTHTACLKEGGKRVTVPARPPSRVIADFDTFARTNFKEHVVGVADVLSIHTALADWRLSRAQTADDWAVYREAAWLLDDAVGFLPLIRRGDRHALRVMMALLLRTGMLVRLAGSGRPVSGSEHVFARAVEDELPVAHGPAVGLGILLMSELHADLDDRVPSAIVDLGIVDRLPSSGLSHLFANRVLSTLAPRPDRETILDHIELGRVNAARVIESVRDRYSIAF